MKKSILYLICGIVIVAALAAMLFFVLSDAGKPFDPTLVPDADVTLPAEERRIGGLGIFLIRQIMDSVEYRRNGERNVLIMSKTILNN